ncbi:ThiJ/PfpI [Gymnopilus junonius]|uniref:ThiJ/PfpI n=1 Tax=Gymnopilus junonius TaxID=109634 RepID=A0A9P5ND87_GYMJU|nr:ThiJ/PfpI [Gymnopilus junonius]
MSPPTLRFGLLLFPGYQWLDAAGTADYINNHSRAMVKLMGVPQEVIDKAPVIEWHYISNNFKPIQASSGPPQIPTNTYKDCPELDYLLIPGPNPADPLPEGCAEFLRERFADPKLKELLLVCTASLAIAPTGILDGYHVCSNKTVLRSMALAGRLYKKVHWIGDRRWHIDGKVWSSAGTTAGIDLAAEFARQHFDKEIVELGKNVAEYRSNPSHPDPFAFILDGIKLD